MRLTLLGHASFYIETAGQRIVTDPYSPQIGLEPVDVETDFVTLSHENPKWHSCLDNIYGQYEVVRGLDIVGQELAVGELKFGAVRVFETLPDAGENAMVLIESEGLRVLHMGDCGHLPTTRQVRACGKVDILLALAGGFPTLALLDLMAVVEELQPSIVIPMHFGVPGLKLGALPVEEFVDVWKGPLVRHQGCTLDTEHVMMGQGPELHVVEVLRLGAVREMAHTGSVYA